MALAAGAWGPDRDLRSPAFRLVRRVSHGVVPLLNYLGSKTLDLSFALFLYHLLGSKLPAGNAPVDHLFLTGLNKGFPLKAGYLKSTGF